MKRILIAVALLAAATACNNSKVYYCENNDHRIYHNSEAEFDTLSYAMGMNLGLGIKLQNGDLGIELDAVAEAMNEELSKQVVERERLAENSALMERFNNEHLRPYTMAKRMGRGEQPEVFNEMFTVERVTNILGCDMANYLRNTLMPINTYWLFRAMEDCKAVGNVKEIDSIMPIKQKEATALLNNYFRTELPAYQKERSEAWLAKVAKMRGVEMYVQGSDTIYYRINAIGSELRPTSPSDTVSFRFELLTRRGTLVESTDKRAHDILARRTETLNDKKLNDSTRNARLELLDKNYASTLQPTIPLGQFMINGAKQALQLIGEGGNITVWLPASMGYGERGNRYAHPNEALVLNISLVDVKPASEAKLTPANITPIKKGETPTAGKPKMIPTAGKAAPEASKTLPAKSMKKQ